MEIFDIWSQKVVFELHWLLVISTLCQSNFIEMLISLARGIYPYCMVSLFFLQCIDKFPLHGWQETGMVASITGLARGLE